MGFSLPLGPVLSAGDGAWPDEPPQDPPQVALPGDQREGLPFQEAAPLPPLACRSRSKGPLKPSVLRVDACLLEKMLGPNRVLLPTFQREFQVLLQVGEPDPEGKVEIGIVGRHWYPKRAKKMIQSLTGKSRRKRCGGGHFFRRHPEMLGCLGFQSKQGSPEEGTGRQPETSGQEEV